MRPRPVLQTAIHGRFRPRHADHSLESRPEDRGDSVFGVDLEAASKAYQATLTADRHCAALCDDGHGHAIPRDAAPSGAEFFAANPFVA